MTQMFVISGQWIYGNPDYDLWEIISKPKYPWPDWSEDDQWRSRLLPRKNMKLGEIIDYLKTEHGGGREMKVHRFRQDGTEVFVTFGGEKLQ